jgi:hypothetical protein
MLNQQLQFDSDTQFGTQLCGHRSCGNVGEHLEEFAKEARLLFRRERMTMVSYIV